ncbi:MAG: PDZ domain-containing protein, partial [Rhodobacteraceae bacterium]|nr:PDZ domain-containing protein [Paracoccaceae bacterium]
LAVIRLETDAALPALDFADSDLAEVGDLVLAIGNPFGIGQTVTTGIVSGLARAGGPGGRGAGYFIQTDAAINPGNSGGALVDMKGRLLGINTSILTRSGGSNGIGFAIPANLVAEYVRQAAAGRSTAERPWSGVDVQPIDADLAEATGLPSPNGVIVSHLHPESPFAAAGLIPGDVITAIGGLAVDGPQELDFRLATRGTGAHVAVTYWRDGHEATAEIVLTPAPGGSSAAMLTIAGGGLFQGLTIAPIDPALIAELRLPLTVEGVVVTGVSGKSRASRLQPGDIVLSLNGVDIATPEDFRAVAENPTRRWQIEFMRDGKRALIRLSGG